MAEIVAPEGSPLGIAVVSCRSLEASLAFYCGEIGFDAGSVVDCSGADFEALWQVPAGTQARACLIRANAAPVGQILLLEYPGASRQQVQLQPNSLVFGLANLNFYVRDIQAVLTALRPKGYHFWSEPTQHSLTPGVGNPIEVIFDGPDGVAINLVELTSRDPTTRIGQMRVYMEAQGHTRTGFSAVVTSSHVCRDLNRARAFYEDVLRMAPLIDEELAAPHVNAFLRLPENARTHITFMQGNHMFGKLALSMPLNYAERCVDLTQRAHAPNIGYLAQAFEVSDFAAAVAAADRLGVEFLLTPRRLLIPGLGERLLCEVRNPGSGALQLIYSR